MSIRLDDETIRTLDAYAAQLRERTRMQATRSDAIRLAIARGLAQFVAEQEVPAASGHQEPRR